MAERVVQHQAVVDAAEMLFVRDGDLDMGLLAREIAVSRATLYRISGGRDRLLGDVLWRRGSRLLRRVRQEAVGEGADLLVDLARRFNQGVIGDAPLRQLLRVDPATAFRVLFMPEGRVHARMVDAWEELICEQVDASHLRPAMECRELAYQLVRIGESVLYSDLLAGRPPDVHVAATVQRALLTAGSETSTGQ